MHPRNLQSHHSEVEKPQRDMLLVPGDADERCYVMQLGRAHHMLAGGRLERPVLSIEHQKVPALVTEKIYQRRIGVTYECAKYGLAGRELGFGVIGSHRGIRNPIVSCETTLRFVAAVLTHRPKDKD